MPLAGEDEVVVTVEPHLAGPAGHARRKRRERRPLRRLALLAAEGAAHAADLAADIGIRHAEHARDDVLDLGRMLRRGIDVHRPVLARDGERDLALEIEMLLAADAERALEPVRCGRDRRRRVATAEGVVRQHRFAARERVLDHDARGLALDLDGGKPRGAARGIAGERHDGKERLAAEGDFVDGKERVIAESRRHVVLSRYVGCGQDGNDARAGADLVQAQVRQRARGPSETARRQREACPRARGYRRCTRPRPARASRRNRAGGRDGRGEGPAPLPLAGRGRGWGARA